MSQTVVPATPCSDRPPVRPPTIAVISRSGSLPAALARLAPRVISGDPGSASESDDVVILFGDRPARDLAELHRLLGRRCPPVLALTRILDPRDVDDAFDGGVTSYIVLSELPDQCIVDAAVRTAAGQSVLSPGAVTVLMSRLREPLPPVAAASQPPVAQELSPRECQVMELLVAGHTIAEIAVRLRLTGKTVRNNLSAIYAKLNVRRQSEAILLWLGHRRGPGEPSGQP